MTPDTKLPTPLLATIILACAAMAGTLPLHIRRAAAQSWTLYDAGQGVFVPYNNAARNADLAASPSVKLGFRGLSGGNFTPASAAFTMDTGSTGILASPDNYMPQPGDQALGAGVVTYSSSGRQNNGTRYLTEVEIKAADGTVMAMARVPVLHVTSITCIRGARECTPTSNPTGLAMMGVGFAREADLQLDGTPEKNPFINITQIRTAAGLAAVPAGFTNGYVVGRGGVTLGLTAADTAGAAFVKLLPDANIAREWQAAPGGVTVNGVSGSGASLVDTGVNKMFLAPPAGTGLVVAQPVPAGTRIGISLPGTGVDGFATYAFTWGGEATALTPADLIIPHGTTPFVNTGRYVLNSFDVIFDSANGYIGYRLREGATGGASLTPALGLQGTVPLPDLFLSSLPVRLLADTTLSSAGTVGLSGGIAGGHALGLTGGGTFNLAGDGTYTGRTRVGAGTTLALATGTEIGSAPVTLDGGTLSFGADTGLANAIALTAAGGTLQPNRRTLTVAGEVSGVGALTIRGPGVTYLGARGTQSGGTRITDGAVVQVFIDATLGAPAAPLTLDGGTLVGVQSFLSYRPVVIGPSGGTFWAGPGIILEFFGDVTQQGPVSMPGPGGVVPAREGHLRRADRPG